MIRAFFAIPILKSERKLLTTAAQPIIENLGENVYWIPPNNWHLTVRFLGNVTGDVIARLSDTAHDIVRHIEKFELKINKLFGFPSANSRTIAAHVFVSDPLNSLFHQLDDAASAEGLSRELRRFRPHITLGKFQTRVYPYDPVLLKDFILSATELVLYQSKPDKQNSQYTPLEVFPFQK